MHFSIAVIGLLMLDITGVAAAMQSAGREAPQRAAIPAEGTRGGLSADKGWSEVERESPELLVSYCVFLLQMEQWLEERVRKEPERRQPIYESAARYLDMEPGDIPIVAAVCRELPGDLERLRSKPSSQRAAALERQGAVDNTTPEFRRD